MITCKQCTAECCRSLAVEIDKPENIEDYEDIKWHLYHKDVWVYIDMEGIWCVQFNTICEKLDQKTNLCTIYENRPPVCKNYKVKGCLVNKQEIATLFRNAEEYDKWLQKNIYSKKKNLNK